ncbi:MAG: nitroreductase family protein [Candidatus Promineifilaceae bacterium]
MDFETVIQRRRMVRNFTDEPVDSAALERILAAGRRGPTAGYSQGQDFIVVTRQDLKDGIAAICHEEEYVKSGFDPFISKAPVLIVPCTNEMTYHRRYQQPDKVDEKGNEIEWPVPYWFMDVGCAVMLLLLAVVNEGLAAGYAGGKDLNAFRQLLNIPDEVTPVGVIPIGHPAPDKRSGSLKRRKRPLRDIVHYEGWE